MKVKTEVTSKAPRKGEDLDGRYGKIGIPAVAAAVAYQSDAKNTAYAPVAPRDDERRFEDVAAA